MMKKVYIAIVLMALVSIAELSAQQDAQYTQYVYNTLAINPAYAGSRGVFSINALHRSQWVGLDGAPTTQTLNFNTPLSERVGIGLSIVNDEIGNGTNQDTYFDGTFSYKIPVSYNANLSFGLKVGGQLLSIDFNKLRNFDAIGTLDAPPNIDNRFEPNFGAGVYYSTDKFYLGLSIPNLLETEHFDTSGQGSTLLASERRNFYLIAGFVKDFGPDWKFKPAVLLKAVEGAPLQEDLSASFLYQEKLSFGAAYRWSVAWSALVGYQITDQFLVGLAYDRETTELGNSAFNDGSFEVFLRYEIRGNYSKILTPRFF